MFVVSSKEDVISFLFFDDLKYIEEFNSKSWDERFLDFWVDRIEVGRVGSEVGVEFIFDFFWYFIISIIMIIDIMISLEYC